VTSIFRANPTKKYIIALVLLTILISILSTSPLPAQAAGETSTIVIQGPTTPPGFLPSLLTVHVYDTVVFVNHSSPTANYAVSAHDGSFSSPAIAPNQQWKVTFNSIGVHEFHAAASPQRMVGEILVVDDSISLLPTSVPSVNATVVALIQSGHTPPDNLLLATPTSSARQVIKKPTATTQPPYIFIVLAILGVLLISGLGFLLVRLRKRRNISEDKDGDEDEDEESTMLTEKTVPKRMGKEKKLVPEVAIRAPAHNPLLRLRRVQVKDDEDDE
jgi:plastocyanin